MFHGKWYFFSDLLTDHQMVNITTDADEKNCDKIRDDNSHENIKYYILKSRGKKLKMSTANCIFIFGRSLNIH